MNQETRFLTIHDVAALLGVGRSKAGRMMRDGTLPSVLIGKSRRVPRELFEQWCHERTAESRQGWNYRQERAS